MERKVGDYEEGLRKGTESDDMCLGDESSNALYV